MYVGHKSYNLLSLIGFLNCWLHKNSTFICSRMSSSRYCEPHPGCSHDDRPISYISPPFHRRRCPQAVIPSPNVSCRRRARWSGSTARPAPACCCSSWLTACGWRGCCSLASACWGSTSLCKPRHPECNLSVSGADLWLGCGSVHTSSVGLLQWTQSCKYI